MYKRAFGARTSIAVALGVCLLASGCSHLRRSLTPRKAPTLVEHFGSEEEAGARLASYINASFDVIVGLSDEDIAAAYDEGGTVELGEHFSMASGVAVDGGELILTAAHVLARGEPFRIQGRGSNDSFSTLASIVWCSTGADLAALRLERPAPSFLNWTDDLEIGDTVYVIGLFDGHSVGEVRALGELSEDVSQIQHTAPVSGGDSGGPLLTEDGELAGIHVNSVYWEVFYHHSEARRVDRPLQGNDCFDEDVLDGD